MLAGATAVSTLLYLNRPASDITEAEYKPVTVDVAQVVKEDLRIHVQAQGTVTPLRSTSIIAEVRGRIDEVSPPLQLPGLLPRGALVEALGLVAEDGEKGDALGLDEFGNELEHVEVGPAAIQGRHFLEPG